MSKALKTYRAEIATVWLPLVGRARLSSHEYELVKKWAADEVPLRLVLRAIKQVSERVRRNNTVVYSLGVIRADLSALMRRFSRSHVGADQAANWRAIWKADLEEIIEMEGNERRKSLYAQLLADLPSLTLPQAKARHREATQAL